MQAEAEAVEQVRGSGHRSRLPNNHRFGYHEFAVELGLQIADNLLELRTAEAGLPNCSWLHSYSPFYPSALSTLPSPTSVASPQDVFVPGDL